MLRIHNSLTGRKEPFAPLVAGQGRHVRLRHHGLRLHATSATRACRWPSTSCAAGCGPAATSVTYVRNITDIDDKIIQRARERGEPIEALTARFIAAMDEDFAALGIAQAGSRAARDRTTCPRSSR